METKMLITELEDEWDLDTGFLGKLRLGIFDSDGFEQLLEKLRSFQSSNEKMIDRRLVSLIWYIPLFMFWQRERFFDQKPDYCNIDQAINQITSIIESILGTP
jgi:hypothetical protein